MNTQIAQFDPAQIKVPGSGGLINLNDPNLKIGTIVSVVLMNYVFYAAGILLLVYLVIGGLQMMISKGDPKAIQAAQGKITNAVIGFIIVVVSFFLVQIIGSMLHLQGTFFGSIFNVR